jgi:CRP-like cAMP-binding protein
VQVDSVTHGRVLAADEKARVLLPGERTSRAGKSVYNRVLLALPDSEFDSLRPFLTSHNLARDANLYEPGGRLEFVHFPNSGLISFVVATREGKTVEVGIVGNESVIGIPALFGLSRSPHHAIVQIEGDALRMSIDDARGVLASTPQLLHISGLHAVIQGMHAAQSAACNRLHAVEQRLARWLLIMQDRLDQTRLHVTHDFLAAMLGTDRPSVSLAAGILQQKGTIRYTRGTVQIIDRKRLETSSCECYAIMQEFNGPLGIR